ncbi:MAG: undecaprenyl-diphosphate phosphatase [Syntrophobacteraceae bacterium]|nr:undecaprenyl-diphosphate phosphatase [Syntrophobacteraceae bacterium]
MIFLKIIVLAILQGACELLPVSSSAHVIIAEKLMGINPVAPAMTLLLVMLHTGTMFAVIIYFRRAWKESYFKSGAAFRSFAFLVAVATFLTGTIALALKEIIEKVFLRGTPHAQVEMIFGNLGLIAISLAVVGILIIFSGRVKRGLRPANNDIGLRESAWIGAVQALCLPFRGFSRSGATISTGLLAGVTRREAEEFSFALVVVLTPPVIIREVYRLIAAHGSAPLGASGMFDLFLPSIVGMVASFLAGLMALRWLSNWLEAGRWKYFGYWCLTVAAIALYLYHTGF